MVASAVEIDALGIRVPGTLCGMDRFLKGPTESVRLNVEHLEFLRSGAGEVAKVIRPRLRALVEQPRGAVAGVGESR